ncbi:MAG: tetratricopeptide repeat protein [Chloroflexi bacterium]|nr:tetratricopeptide repeat protein [Chloroflexota bacterium]
MNVSLPPDAAQNRRRIWLLGGLRVEQDGEPVSLPGGKVRSLLARLALPPLLPHHRDALGDLLWPDAPLDRVRPNFSNALYQLQQALNPDWLVVDNQTVALRRDGLWVDVHWFHEGCATPEHQPDYVSRLQSAAALYTADLLPDLYDDWVLGPQVALREQYLNTLIKLGLALEARQNFRDAQQSYEKAVREDPLREEAYWGVMRTLARQGRFAAALQTYQQLVTQLESELGVPPSHQSQQLADRIQQELTLATAAPRATAAERPRLPFVGRLVERQTVLSVLTQAGEGRGGLILLLGEAGIGKTRLLTELAEAAAWRGWQVAWGRGQEFTLPSAYAPLTAALHEALPLPRLQQLVHIVPPPWLHWLERLVPGVREVITPAPPAPEADQTRLTQAMVQVWRGLQTIAPHLLILDDVQWASPALWPLLAQVQPYLAELKVVLVLSGRTTELESQPETWSLWQTWQADGTPLLRLAGLSRGELEQIAAAYQNTRLSSTQLEHLNRASGGNPLLALSLLESEAWDESAAAPPSLLDLIRRRLAHLSLPAHQALQAAAVLGAEFAYPIWADVLLAAGIAPTTLPALAGELERERLILLHQRAYRFAHDLLRAAVYESLPTPARQAWHGHALRVLRQHTPADSLALLYHAEQAAATPDIPLLALQAGEQALGNFTYRLAVTYFTQALRALPPEQVKLRYQAVRGRAQALNVLADRTAQQADITHLQTLAGQSGDPRWQAEAASLQVEVLWQTGQWDEGERVARRALTWAQQADDPKLLATLQTSLGQIMRDKGDYAAANQWFAQAEQGHQTLGDGLGVAYSIQMRGVVAQRSGDYQQAIELLRHALDLIATTNDPFFVLRLQSNLAVAYWMSSDYAQARELFNQVLRLSREVGDKRVEAAALGNLGALAGLVADFPASAEFLTQALRLERTTNNKPGIAGVSVNLGKTLSHLGRLAEALTFVDEALALNQALGRRRGEGYAWHIRGMVLLQMARLAEAEASLHQARTIRQELGERDNLLYTDADLVLLYVTSGQVHEAGAIVAPLLAALETEPVNAEIRQASYFAAYRYFGVVGDVAAARQHLLLAQSAMHEIAAPLAPPDRARFLGQLPLNQQIQAALAEWQQQVMVQLVRADVPLGRKRTPDDYVTVTWTISALEDEAIADKTARRQAVVARMLRDAAAQHAAPTDADLAQALGVSRRTIIRDMKTLAKQGQLPPTRRR